MTDRKNRNTSDSFRQELLLDKGWKFHPGPITIPPLIEHSQTYLATKSAGSRGPAAMNYWDSTWHTVDVPHDWLVDEAFDPAGPVSQGFKCRGTGWYRRYFHCDQEDRTKSLCLRFDGVCGISTIYLNGHKLRVNAGSYTSFHLDITDFANFGQQVNVLAVHVDASEPTGWWYEGAGIYRHVWLIKTNNLHLDQWGLWANPRKESGNTWSVEVQAAVKNEHYFPVQAVAHLALKDGAIPIAETQIPLSLAARDHYRLRHRFKVTNPMLWSMDCRRLYQCVVELGHDGTIVDNNAVEFGFRTIRFDTEKGFFLNGESLKLQGTCNHQDHAGLGVALPDRIHEFHIEKLKEMGCNAYRCAHNPPAPEFLDACDRLGMLVIDETRLFSSSDEGLFQLRSMILPDRNHPCVISWSIFNEEPLQGTAKGRRIAEKMIHETKRLDDSRPVTGAFSGGLFEEGGIAGALDIVGINYQEQGYDSLHKTYPDKPIWGTEIGGTCCVRGVYETTDESTLFSAYDDQCVLWGCSLQNAWQAVVMREWLAGAFIWSGFDYMGEPTPKGWPVTNCFFGVLDTCGFPKDSFYLCQAMWKDEPMVHLLPHWNWDDKPGQPIRVVCYSNCDRVRLLLNGREINNYTVDRYRAKDIAVPFEKGTLVAEGYVATNLVCSAEVHSTGSACALVVEPKQVSIMADHEDIAILTVRVVDSDGRTVPTGDNDIHFNIDGPGTILAMGNGNPICHEPRTGNAHSAFMGLAQIIIQSTGQTGDITVNTTSPGLKAGSCTISSQPCAQKRYVEFVKPTRLITQWLKSPGTSERPDPTYAPSSQDMNSWEAVEIGASESFSGWAGKSKATLVENGQFVVYRCTLQPPAEIADQPIDLKFAGIDGQVELWINDEQVAEGMPTDDQCWEFVCTDWTDRREITLVVVLKGNPQACFNGPVSFRIADTSQ